MSDIKKVMDTLIGKIVEIEIKDISSRPFGFIKYKEFEFLTFVLDKCLIPKQKVRIKILRRKKRFFESQLIKKEDNDSYYNKNICKLYEQCENCNLLHLNDKILKNYYENDLKLLEDKLNLKDKEIKLINSKRIGFRTKFRGFLNFKFIQNKLIPIIGFYDINKNIIEINDLCLIQNKELNQILIKIKKQIKDLLNLKQDSKIFNLLNNNNNTFLLSKDIILNINPEVIYNIRDNSFYLNENYSIYLDFNKNNRISMRLINLIEDIFYEIFLSDNKLKQIIIKSRRTKSYKKEKFLYDLIKDKDLEIKQCFLPGIFKQTNSYMNLKLINRINELLSKNENNFNLYELFSGNANLSLFSIKNNIKKKIKSYFGFESNKASIQSLNYSLLKNDIGNSKTYLSDLTKNKDIKKLKKLVKKSTYENIFLVDPPRNMHISKIISDIMPDKLIYVSCSQTSFVNDLIKLKEYYNLLNITAYEMFVNTRHLEMFAYLELKRK